MIYETAPEGFEPEVEVVACYVRHLGTFILLQRAPEKSHGGAWGLPAGKVDDGETPLQAVRREVREEVGRDASEGAFVYIDTLHVRILQEGEERVDLIYHTYLLDLSAPHAVVLSPKEHTASRWVVPEEALGMGLVHDLDACIKRHLSILRNEK